QPSARSSPATAIWPFCSLPSGARFCVSIPTILRRHSIIVVLLACTQACTCSSMFFSKKKSSCKRLFILNLPHLYAISRNFHEHRHSLCLRDLADSAARGRDLAK